MVVVKELEAPSMPVLTYEQYLAEGEITQPYDILDGVRITSPAPSVFHQIVTMNLSMLLRGFERSGKQGRALAAPTDVIITPVPLRTRQPDVFFISNEQLQRHGSVRRKGGLTVAPELVVEVKSPDESERDIMDKMADFRHIGTREGWIVRPARETVQQLSLSERGIETVATYTIEQMFASLAFPDLRVAVADIFAE